MRIRPFVPLTLLVLLAFAPAANASVISYASRTAFNAAVTGVTTDGFEGITTPTSNGIGNVPEGTSFARVGYTVTDGGIAGATLNVLDNTYVNGGNQIRNRFGAAAGSVVDAAFGDLTFTFATGITSFGIDIATIVRGFAGTSTSTFTYTIDGGAVNTFNYSGSSGFGFIGFTSTLSFNTITINNVGHSNDDLFDNVSFARAAITSVPEPESFALLGIGLVGVVASLRRRK